MKIQEILPGNLERVERNTARAVKEQIERRSQQDIAALAHEGPEAIERRITELEQEWDIERALEVNASLMVLASTALGTFVNRKWFGLTALASGFLLQHALQGWCPPLPVMRRLGVRTHAEIADEIMALRILRGDLHETRAPRRAIADQARRPENGIEAEPPSSGTGKGESGRPAWTWPFSQARRQQHPSLPN